MYTKLIPDQNEIIVFPVDEQLSESELDVIAHHHKLEKYTVKENSTFKYVNGKFVFEYYSYTFKY